MTVFVDDASSVSVTFKNGDAYEGQLWRSFRCGEGVLKTNEGQEFKGIFKDDVLHGVGKWTAPNGDFYEGDFEAGNWSGNGCGRVTLAADGSFDVSGEDVYEGPLLNGELHGIGKMHWRDGDMYKRAFSL